MFIIILQANTVYGALRGLEVCIIIIELHCIVGALMYNPHVFRRVA